jgi:peptide methionine sulfoxide reductase msrA/msrB
MKKTIIASLVLTAVFFGYQQVRSMDDKMEKPMDKMAEHTQSAVFAGGCFWCTESDFEKVDGVIQAVSGYTGGRMENPTYKQVSAGGTGHVEAIKVVYDPDQDILRPAAGRVLASCGPHRCRRAVR